KHIQSLNLNHVPRLCACHSKKPPTDINAHKDFTASQPTTTPLPTHTHTHHTTPPHPTHTHTHPHTHTYTHRERESVSHCGASLCLIRAHLYSVRTKTWCSSNCDRVYLAHTHYNSIVFI